MILVQNRIRRGGEWYLEKRGSRKILAGSRNLGSVFDKSRSLVFSWFAFTFFESRNFSPKSLRLGFLTRISVSRRVSDFTIHHPYQSLKGSVTHHYPNFPWAELPKKWMKDCVIWHNYTVELLWFNFIPGLNFIPPCLNSFKYTLL